MEEHASERAIARFARAEDAFATEGGYAAESEVRQIVAGLGLGADRIVVLPTGFACGLARAPTGAIAKALHSLNLLVARQLYKRVAGTAFLKASCPLQVVELAENFHPRGFAERNRGRTGRIINCASNAFACRLDVLKCNQAFNSRALPAPLPIGQSESGTGYNLRNPSPAGDKT